MNRLRKSLLALSILCATVTPLWADNVFIEAENFDLKGGWLVDQQFMDQMGSPYLLAHGLGKPVENATTSVNIKTQGTYEVYVRTYNWTSPWWDKEGPGAFSLSVNNKRLHTVLGTKGNGWQWQKVGTTTLKKGKNTIALHDLTGFDGRCDAIFMTNTNTVPPENAKELTLFRQKYVPNLTKIAATKQFDFVVIGGGTAGMSAALSAARLGLKVALIQNRPLLGGNNSSEVRVHLGGKINIGLYKHLGDLQKEFAPTLEGNAQPAHRYADDKKLSVVRAEKNISLFLNYHVNAVETQNNTIVSVTAQNTHTAERICFEAPLFADCTGDATVGYLAKADYHAGREGKDFCNEPLAPEKADSMVMGASVQWYAEKGKKHTFFPLFNYGMNFNDTTAEKIERGDWTWETGLNKNQITDFERIRDYGMLVVYANWSFLKNKSIDKKDFAKSSLKWVAYVAGKRESRRLLGDYILSEHDLTRQIEHEDASFPTTWSIDLHYPDSLNEAFFPNRPFKAVTKQKVLYPYNVPFRCLYSRNVNNLLMAGRNMSATHVALGSIRVMRTTAMMGEVIGMAAAICKEYNTTPRMVYQRYFPQLKALMSKGVGKAEVPNSPLYNEGWNLPNPPVVK